MNRVETYALLFAIISVKRCHSHCHLKIHVIYTCMRGIINLFDLTNILIFELIFPPVSLLSQLREIVCFLLEFKIQRAFYNIENNLLFSITFCMNFETIIGYLRKERVTMILNKLVFLFLLLF